MIAKKGGEGEKKEGGVSRDQSRRSYNLSERGGKSQENVTSLLWQVHESQKKKRGGRKRERKGPPRSRAGEKKGGQKTTGCDSAEKEEKKNSHQRDRAVVPGTPKKGKRGSSTPASRF